MMEENMLHTLASIVLPSQILEYFRIVSVKETGSAFHIGLEELMNKSLSDDVNFESKGFMKAVHITDFPIREHKVILKVRRMRWRDLRTGKSFTLPIAPEMVARGIRYSKEFEAFLKETYGDLSSNLPYA